MTEATDSPLIVGIDLGTTNSAIASADPADVKAVTTQTVAQYVAPGEWGEAAVLPSFLYVPEDATSLQPPWDDAAEQAVGTAARDLGRLRPGRLVASSKSWLCHPGIDRTAAILPWHGETDCPRVSPVDAAAAVLSHLRSSWDAAHPNQPLAEQDVVITLPASFDEVARELTVRAAQKAGLPRVLLIEEPQAAFYAWMHRHADWAERVRPGDVVLVCDIGGGTSDFSLIEARQTRDGRVDFQRRAVGEHLLLGGDNLDAALAAHLEPRFAEAHGPLSPADYNALIRQCRLTKEQLFSNDCPAEVTIALPGRGRGLVAQTRSIRVDADELRAVLISGFLPPCDLADRPEAQQSGFQEFGLPFASDPAITRHLAAFLSQHGRDGQPVRPDHVLFNGGFFAADSLRDQLTAVLTSWFDHDAGWSLGVLDHDDLYQAVARGAACYGLARRGLSEKIAAGLPRTFYVGVGSAGDQSQAVCVAPAGLEPGDPVTIEQPSFRLALARPVEFPVYSSASRLDDEPGKLLTVDPDQLTALPPIRTVLRSRRKEADEVSVRLASEVSEIGTLRLSCVGEDDRRWGLQFDVRSATQTDQVGHTGAGEAVGIIEDDVLDAARDTVERFGAGDVKPKRLFKTLEEAVALPREQWPPTLLRAMWESAINLPANVRTRPGGEARWLHLVGFALRPGYGVALDDWRAASTYKLIAGKLKSAASVDAARILWRRVAGGLTAGQQQSLVEPVLTAQRGGVFELEGQSVAEVWRMIGSFERLPPRLRSRLATDAIDQLDESPHGDALLWALARLLTRVPTYGSLDAVLPASLVQPMIPKLTAHLTARRESRSNGGTSPASSADASTDGPNPLAVLAIVQACRLTGDRYRDLDEPVRQRAAAALEAADAKPELVAMLHRVGRLPSEQQSQTLGDSLPPGLSLA